MHLSIVSVSVVVLFGSRTRPSRPRPRAIEDKTKTKIFVFDVSSMSKTVLEDPSLFWGECRPPLYIYTYILVVPSERAGVVSA